MTERSRFLLLCSLCFAPAALADAFPWDGTVSLTDKRGRTLTWTLKRVEGEVHISGSHPHWQVEHRAKPDGTPLATTKRAKGATTKVTYTSTGAQVEQTDASGKTKSATITEPGLWDGDTLDARLAGLDWSAKKPARMKIVDVDSADGTTYPMRADALGQEQCGTEPCHRVKLGLDDFRRAFAPTFEYRFGASTGARYLQHDGDGLTFVAR